MEHGVARYTKTPWFNALNQGDKNYLGRVTISRTTS